MAEERPQTSFASASEPWAMCKLDNRRRLGTSGASVIQSYEPCRGRSDSYIYKLEIFQDKDGYQYVVHHFHLQYYNNPSLPFINLNRTSTPTKPIDSIFSTSTNSFNRSISICFTYYKMPAALHNLAVRAHEHHESVNAAFASYIAPGPLPPNFAFSYQEPKPKKSVESETPRIDRSSPSSHLNIWGKMKEHHAKGKISHGSGLHGSSTLEAPVPLE